MNTVPFQTELRPELPNVYGTLDYQEFRSTLIKIDEILTKSGLETQLVMEALNQYVATNNIDSVKFYNSRQVAFHHRKLRHALRCNIARHLTGESYRLFSIRLADSALFQWFTNISDFGCRQAISKSSLERYEKCFDEALVTKKICECLAALSDPNKALESGLHQTIDCKNVFIDSTCIKANIHFPVDWVLLRDAARSLLSAIKTIRAKGLKHRMIEPHLLLRQMNKLSIAMTHVRRKANGKKQRKVIFRSMKTLGACIAKHAKRYRQLLNNEWEKTDWTYAQAQQVIRRIDLILEQLPAAIKQAHERIVGERLVPSENKILSLYDKDAHVIVRGKAGNEVEFGQGLLLTEQINGLIIDWQLFGEQPPSDSKLLAPAIARIEKYYGPISSACGDRGFSGKNNVTLLKEHDVYDAICPKSPKELQERLSDPIFLSLQTRRSQTEARIGIFKNVFLGKPLRSRITSYKRIAVTWCVLTHNLWLLSRMAIEYERSAEYKLSLLKKAA
jgi:hypothetical protein